MIVCCIAYILKLRKLYINVKYDFIVLGATGMQGKIASRDLLENGYSVLLCGRKKERAMPLLKKYKNAGFEYVEMENISNVVKKIRNSGANIVLNCVEGDWNLNALEACKQANVHCLDLGSEIWMTKEQLKLNGTLKRKNLIHITGCGSVPGIGNVMLAYAAKKLSKIKTIEVGFDWSSNIKKFVVPFSIQSIIEEFTDPAPILENGKFVKVTPMDTIVKKNIRKVGNQYCFIVRHPETYTFYHYFKDKGVKNIRFYAGFPKHSFDVIKSMIEVGFGRNKEITIKENKAKTLDFLTEVLKDLEFPKDYREKENLWVKIKGSGKGKNKTINMECIVHTLKGWEDAGSNIDTGMTISIMAQMIKKGIIKARGSFAPEAIVPPEPFFEELRKRSMIVYENGKVIN